MRLGFAVSARQPNRRSTMRNYTGIVAALVALSVFAYTLHLVQFMTLCMIAFLLLVVFEIGPYLWEQIENTKEVREIRKDEAFKRAMRYSDIRRSR
jgi:uncharacterized protein (DUF58 family)